MPIQPLKIQSAFFLSTIDLTSKLKVATAIIESSGGLLDVDPTIIKLPSEVPGEIPFLIIHNEKTGWKFGMAGNRFDLFFENMDLGIEVDPEKIRQQIFSTSLNIWNTLAGAYSAKAFRLGLIQTLIVQEPNPIEQMISIYLKSAEAQSSSEIHYEYLDRKTVNGLAINRWIKLNAAVPITGKPPATILEVDVNTQQENPVDVNSALARSFFDTASEITLAAVNLHLRR